MKESNYSEFIIGIGLGNREQEMLNRQIGSEIDLVNIQNQEGISKGESEKKIPYSR